MTSPHPLQRSLGALLLLLVAFVSTWAVACDTRCNLRQHCASAMQSTSMSAPEHCTGMAPQPGSPAASLLFTHTPPLAAPCAPTLVAAAPETNPLASKLAVALGLPSFSQPLPAYSHSTTHPAPNPRSSSLFHPLVVALRV